MDEKKTAVAESAKKTHSGKQPVCENLSFAAKEAFKRLRTNLVMSFPQEDTSCHLIGVTSAQPSDGKSTIAINLAYSLAELGKKTLGNTNSISSAMRKYHSGTSETAFDIIPGGDAPQNPSELLNSKRMSSLLQTLSTAYDFIVIDLPPIGAVVDAVSVAREIDGMLVVIRENTCPRGLLAFVVNGALEGSSKKYQYDKKYGYYNNYYY